MRWTTLACALVVGATATYAADVDDAESSTASDSPVVDTPAVAAIVKPTFTAVTGIKAPFLEQFTDDWEKRWKASHAKKINDREDEEWAYVGSWSVEEPTVLKGMEGDKGLVVKNAAAHHAISAKFPKAISNKKDTLVVQYEVKLQDGLECGGAYLKLLQDNKKLQSDEFSNASPYIIMFGPDKCGSTNKVHFIFRHKNPKSGEYEEKHLTNPPQAQITKRTSLYTLIVKPDQTFEIKIDGESKRNGSLLENFTPSVNPPKEIDDETDKKPETWVDEAQIPDPAASKPEDWDEDAPFEIVDEDAMMPDDWLVDEATTIPDPEAVKPEDWDDEEDGDWSAPTVSNPKCEDVSGCGPWEKPLKRNDAYKGPWSAPMIDNPLYKGVWAPRKVPNPNYFEDKTPANFEPMGAIGFEIWTMQKDILFDNIYIGHSIADAEKLKAATFDLKHPVEKAEEDVAKPKADESVVDPTKDMKFLADPVKYAKHKFELFVTLAKKDPVMAAKAVPEVAGTAVGLLLLVIALLVGAVGGGGAATKVPSQEELKAKAKAAKDKAVAAKEVVAEAVASGAEKTAETTKRTTRSTAGS